MAFSASRRGIALISIVLVMLVMTLLAITFVATTTAQSRFSMNRQNNTVLRQTALIGINEMQKLMGTEDFKYRWHKADKWTKNGTKPIERFVPENNSYYRIVVNSNECRPDWCIVTSEAYFNKDAGTGLPIPPIKRISVTFKKNCFQYAALGTSQGDLGVKIVGSTYTATGMSKTSSRSSMALSRRPLALSYRSGNPSYTPPSYTPPSSGTSPAVSAPADPYVLQGAGAGAPADSTVDDPSPETVYQTHESMSVVDGDVGACRKSSVAICLGDTRSSSASSSQSRSSGGNVGNSTSDSANTLTVSPANTKDYRIGMDFDYSGNG
ncbi:MAG: hypothetical protein AB9903_04925 [Vulcanimicrobiota bacterium]